MPLPHPELEIAEFDTELVVLDPRVDRVHHVVGLIAVVFDACDGTTTVEQLAAELADALAISPADADGQVRAALGVLGGNGLLEGTDPPEEPPPCLGCQD